ncbi:Polyadenylate-binding protein-interacting protein 11 [Striga hermonthica]|uniref:Polyadenylate-binding protein-interacting protein 11 n=1 Tax=Striga hermonthica TaxID=68872 RepID=A0A9N7RD03_STRHE|nr:Polyadenylate-binding protein-interacting protein 11 [Striga hermonthica]
MLSELTHQKLERKRKGKDRKKGAKNQVPRGVFPIMAVMDNAGANAVQPSKTDTQPNGVAAADHDQKQPTKAAYDTQKSIEPAAGQDFPVAQQKISNGRHGQIDGSGVAAEGKTNGEEGLKREMRDLEEMLSKLNPMAKEFVPPSLSFLDGGQPRFLVAPPHVVAAAAAGHFGFTPTGFLLQQPMSPGAQNGNSFRKTKNGYTHGKRRLNNTRTSKAQREDVIRRTVYVSDIDHQVTEEQLAALFINCGQVVDCRVCGDPNSVLRFAFIEFTNEEGARNALSMSGTVLGYYPVRVLPSKTAIAPVNPTFLPRSEDEREMCARTIYCTNIDRKVTLADVKIFFESLCGEVHRLRLLGDYHHSTRIAFVEFVMAESAIAALNCSGAVLGSYVQWLGSSDTDALR